MRNVSGKILFGKNVTKSPPIEPHKFTYPPANPLVSSFVIDFGMRDDVIMNH